MNTNEETLKIKRLNRHLAHSDLRLRTSRSCQERIDMGRYYVLDLRSNCVARHDVELDALLEEARSRRGETRKCGT